MQLQILARMPMTWRESSWNHVLFVKHLVEHLDLTLNKREVGSSIRASNKQVTKRVQVCKEKKQPNWMFFFSGFQRLNSNESCQSKPSLKNQNTTGQTIVKQTKVVVTLEINTTMITIVLLITPTIYVQRSKVKMPNRQDGSLNNSFTKCLLLQPQPSNQLLLLLPTPFR